MDYTLRCNSLKCRSSLHEQAVVTTCSHIFCLSCSEVLGLSNSNSVARTCPACNTQLVNPDDAVVTQLNPSEDYKTSVLSGLSPSIMMECAARGMAFWSYQATQEIFYQEFLMKSMTDKYQSLSAQMDKLINNANAEISGSRDKISALQLEHKELDSKNQQLAEAYNKKCRDNGQLHKLYQQAKQKQVTESMAEAAAEDATNVVQSLEAGYKPGLGAACAQRLESRSRSNGSGQMRYTYTGSVAGRPIHRAPPTVVATPSGHHRTQLPHQPRTTHHLYQGPSVPVVPASNSTTFRQPLGDINPNAFVNASGSQGLPAGVKIGRQPQRPFNFSPTGVSRTHDANPFGFC